MVLDYPDPKRMTCAVEQEQIRDHVGRHPHDIPCHRGIASQEVSLVLWRHVRPGSHHSSCTWTTLVLKVEVRVTVAAAWECIDLPCFHNKRRDQRKVDQE